MNVESSPTILPPGDSAVQRAAEGLILERVGKQIRVTLRPRIFGLRGGARITVDGVSADPPTLVEAWAHIGAPKPAQKNKVMTDALKLLWIRNTLLPDARCILALADKASAAPFLSSRTWMGFCLRDLGMEVLIVDLPPDVRVSVMEAQKRQYR